MQPKDKTMNRTENLCRCCSGSTLFPFLLLLILAYGFSAFFVLPAAAQSQSPERGIRIGVLANRGVEHCLEQWSPTAAYLSAEIDGYSFKIVPLDFKEINQVVERGEVDFIFVNPANYVELEALYGVSRIATMENLRQGKPYTIFGGVIFCRADRKDIRTLEDLKGKSFMAVEENSFGGWIMAWRELQEHGLNPRRDFKQLSFGGTHDQVVYSVLAGKVDAGTVRTDTLERMAQEGAVDLQDFFVIDEHLKNSDRYYSDDDFPFRRSTRLYPEWPFAKAKNTSDQLAKLVAVALFNMKPESEAARAALVTGWMPPLHYQPVHGCLIDLRLGPYAALGNISFREIVSHYWPSMLLSAVVIITLAFLLINTMRLNRKLDQSRRLLARGSSNLETRVQQRTAELRELNRELEQEALIRRQAEEKAGLALAELDQVLNAAGDGMTVIDNDFNLLMANDTFLRLMGINIEIIGRKCYDVYPGPRCATPGCPLRQVAAGKERLEGEDEKETFDGRVIPCLVATNPLRSPSGELIGVVQTFKDISDRKKSELALAEYAMELARSNEELNHFAYVASHDLQEPLRMVASYVQLLARRYQGKLDTDADEFIAYAVDGAERMQQLIHDLLEYSRVDSRGKAFTACDCGQAADLALKNLEIAVRESGAIIEREELPVVNGDCAQIGRLFQNLIGNAVKFRGNESPAVRISAERSGEGWTFAVRDNGIGIDPQFFERIFVIFQRLHGRKEYSGTGIGLAISRKIVERHGGRIWVESEPGKGSVFKFVLPAYKGENKDEE